MLSTNNKYKIFEESLHSINSIDETQRKLIVELHKQCYQLPINESAGGVAKIVGGAALLVGGIVLCCTGIGSGAGAPAIISALGILGTAAGTAATISGAHDAYKNFKSEEQMMDTAISMSSILTGEDDIAIQSANETKKIITETKGTLLDKCDAVGARFNGLSNKNEYTENESEFSSKYGFDSKLNITDPVLARNHAREYFNYKSGLNTQGNKIRDEKLYEKAMAGFPAYWSKKKDLFYFTDAGEKEDKDKYMKSYLDDVYKNEFAPSFMRKCDEMDARNKLNNGIVNTNVNNQNKKEYYASMGFNEDGMITDKPLFMKHFTNKTGLNANYQPVNRLGEMTYNKIFNDPEYKWMQYATPAVFLMSPEDVAKQKEKAKLNMQTGEIKVSSLMSGEYDSEDEKARQYEILKQKMDRDITRRNSERNVAGVSTSSASATTGTNTSASTPKEMPAGINADGTYDLIHMYDYGSQTVKHQLAQGFRPDGNGKLIKLTPSEYQLINSHIKELREQSSRASAENYRKFKLERGMIGSHEMSDSERSKAPTAPLEQYR